MQGVVNFLRGSARVQVVGAFPERLLNLCAQRAVAFWALEWVDANTLRLRVAKKDLGKLEQIARRTMCDLTVEGRLGLPFFLLRFRRRYALLAGFALCLAAACVLSRFILVIEVTGNERLPTSVILGELQRSGVKVGAYGPSVDERVVSHKMLLALEDLSFFAVNLHGTRAEVVVRERDPAPELADETTPANVTAGATGILTRIEVMEGQAKFKAGDTVLAGEVVISGVVDLQEPAYSTNDLGVMLVHARGQVWARTWRTLEARLPLEAEVKSYTGRKMTRISLALLGRRINFYGNSGISFPEYDKISTGKALTLPDGTVLPFSLQIEEIRAYETVPVPVDAGAGRTLLEEHLEQRLLALIGEDGQVKRLDYSAREEDGVLIVTLLAECVEQIGSTAPLAQG